MKQHDEITMLTDKPQMETIAKTAEILGLPEYFVRTKVKSGEIVAVRAGRKTLVNVTWFKMYLNTHTLADEVKPSVTAEPTANKYGISPISLNDR